MNKKIIGKRVISFIMVMAMCVTNLTLYSIDAHADEEVTVNVSNAISATEYAQSLISPRKMRILEKFIFAKIQMIVFVSIAHQVEFSLH